MIIVKMLPIFPPWESRLAQGGSGGGASGGGLSSSGGSVTLTNSTLSNNLAWIPTEGKLANKSA